MMSVFGRLRGMTRLAHWPVAGPEATPPGERFAGHADILAGPLDGRTGRQ
jgi:hypothetical protein